MPTAQSTSNQSATTGSSKNKSNKPENVKTSGDNINQQALVDVINQDQETQNQSEKQASGISGNKTPQEQPEFIKQALILIEKKVRNLEKRRVCICLKFKNLFWNFLIFKKYNSKNLKNIKQLKRKVKN